MRRASYPVSIRRASRPRPAAGPDTRFGDGKNTMARSISRRSASVSFGSARSVLMGSRATAVKLLCHRCHRRQSACVTCHGRDTPDLPNGRAPKPCRAPEARLWPTLLRVCRAGTRTARRRRRATTTTRKTTGRGSRCENAAWMLVGPTALPLPHIARVRAGSARSAPAWGVRRGRGRRRASPGAPAPNARSAFKPRWGRRGATRLPRRARRPAARACSASRPRAPAAGARFPCTGRRAPDIGTSPGPQLSAPHSALA
jgi:hypothetical protein